MIWNVMGLIWYHCNVTKHLFPPVTPPRYQNIEKQTPEFCQPNPLSKDVYPHREQVFDITKGPTQRLWWKPVKLHVWRHHCVDCVGYWPTTAGYGISWHNDGQIGPVARIPQCTSLVSHNAPFCNRNVHVGAHFCYKMVHCGTSVGCIVGFVRWVY